MFALEFFVCDWYRNVDCENSERFYNLNDQLGNTMGGASKNDMTDSAREIIMFPQQTPAYSPENDIYSDYPSQLGSSLGINGGPSRGNGLSQGSSNFGQTSSSLDNFPNFSTSGGPSDGSSGSRGGSGGPSRGSGGSGGPSRGSGGPSGGSGGSRVPGSAGGNGGTVFVNNLGQLSTDKDSIGFDPKASFFLKPEKDSEFDKDSFDPIKGIENSYSFGFPDGSNNSPIRGSADLSEPVDPSAFPTGDEYLPPKQLFTYPHDDIAPEFTGKINTELAAQSPKYEAPGIYGPAVSPQSASPNRYQQPSQSTQQNRYQDPNVQKQSQPQRPHQQLQRAQSPSSSYQQPQQPSSLYQQPKQPSSLYQQPQQPSSLYQQPSSPSNQYQQPQQSQAPSSLYDQPSSDSNSYQQPSSSSGFQRQPSAPSGLYQQPSAPTSLYQQPQKPSVPSGLYQQPQNFAQRQQSQPSGLYQQPHSSQNQQAFQPQAFRPQSQQSERRQFNVPQNNQNGNSYSNGNGQSNQEYLHNLLKDKTHIHEDKQQLTELIQRFFVPAATQERVVSTEVFPSPAKESYSFTYEGEGASSNNNNNYQPARSGNHQHTGGHQGYHY